MRAADHRSERYLSQRVADRQVLRLRHQFFGQRPNDLILSQHAARGHADLTLMEPGAESDRGSRRIEIGVLHDDHGILAAEFELHFLQMLAGEFADPAPDMARTGERHHGDVGIGANRLARLGAARQDLQHAFGQLSLLENPGNDESAGQCGARIGLEHHRVAGRERGRDRAARQDEREIERRNHADDATRQPARDADAAGIGRQHQALRLGAHGGGTIEDFRHHMDFESGLGRDAAGLPRDPGDQLFLIFFQNPGGLAQDGAAFLIGRRGPAGLRGARLGGGAAHVGRGGVADASQRGAGSRLQNVQRSAGRVAPFRAEYASAPSPLDKKFCYRCVHPVSPLFFIDLK